MLGVGVVVTVFLTLVARGRSPLPLAVPLASACVEQTLLAGRACVRRCRSSSPRSRSWPESAGSGELFNIVFFVVLASTLIQGTTIPAVARWLRLDGPAFEQEPIWAGEPVQRELVESTCRRLLVASPASLSTRRWYDALDCARPNCSWNSQTQMPSGSPAPGTPRADRVDDSAAAAPLRHDVQHAQADRVRQRLGDSRESHEGILVCARAADARLGARPLPMSSSSPWPQLTTRNLDLVLTAPRGPATLEPTKVDLTSIERGVRDERDHRPGPQGPDPRPLRRARRGGDRGQVVLLLLRRRRRRAAGRVRPRPLRRGRDERPPRRGRARQPRLRQPDGARRPAARRGRAGPRQRRRDRRPAVRPPRRPHRQGLRARHDRRDARARAGEPAEGRRHQRRVPQGRDRDHPAARRLRGRRHQQLRHQPLAGQGQGPGRGLPRAAGPAAGSPSRTSSSRAT